MNVITNVPRVGNTFSENDQNPYWKQEDSCSGFTVDDSCKWRWEEMELITFTPQICLDRTLKGCEFLVAYARINIAPQVQ